MGGGGGGGYLQSPNKTNTVQNMYIFNICLFYFIQF